ncbi:hypothetical protein BN439_1637 [Erwinia amylovora Ea644]|nr:hypothetical protein BN439_1637 [Erwinia amylovora Ea644]CCP06730.1 hypothetical protein BN440_1698 [Erwinia amylovora MR1]
MPTSCAALTFTTRLFTRRRATAIYSAKLMDSGVLKRLGNWVNA